MLNFRIKLQSWFKTLKFLDAVDMIKLHHMKDKNGTNPV